MSDIWSNCFSFVSVTSGYIIAGYNCNFLSLLNYFKGANYDGFLLDCTKTFTDSFVMKVSNVGRFQNRVYIASISQSQKKENKI